MKQTLMALRAAGVLLAIWAILAGVAFAAGVLPSFGGGESVDDTPAVEDDDHDAQAESTAESEDGGTADADVGALAADDPEDGDQASSEPVPTYAVCAPDVAHASLTALEVVSDPRPEIAIGCGPRVMVYAFADGEPEPVRVATLDAAIPDAASTNEALFAGPVASMDIDGDGLSDLVVPFRGMTQQGDTRGGGLFLVRRDAMGAFEPAVSLAPIASSQVTLAQLDGQPGFEILSTNRGSDLARRPSQVWVFNGGAAPARASVLAAGIGDVAVTVADLDRDGHEDAIVTAAGTEQVKIHFGDGTAHFPRTAEVALTGATEVVAGDVDGDGGEDVIVRSTGLHLIAAGPAESLVPQPIDAPASIHDVSLRDVDGDRKRDIVGIDGSRLVWLRQGEDLTFTEETLIAIEGATLRHYALADLDGDGKTDLVALGRGAEEGAPWSLAVVPDVREAERIVFAAEGASAPANAPLTLRVALR